LRSLVPTCSNRQDEDGIMAIRQIGKAECISGGKQG